MRRRSTYSSFLELTQNETPQHYRIVTADRNSDVLILTPHGGGIEPGTSEIVKAMAGQIYSWYCFEGIRQTGNEKLHITSTCFDEPTGIQMAAKSAFVLAVHGCGDRREKVFVGGLHVEWVQRFIAAYKTAGFPAEQGYGDISGQHRRNICNHGRLRKGVQIELSEGVRRVMFRGLDREGRKHPTPVFEQFIEAGKRVLAG